MSAKEVRFGESALVLWHGTSRERVERIAEHVETGAAGL